MVGFSGPTRPYLYPYPIIITLPYPYVKLPYPGGPYPTPGDPTSGRTYIGFPPGGPLPAPPKGRFQKFITRVYPTVSVNLRVRTTCRVLD